MQLRDAKQTETELERLRIELAILRAAKVRNDLTRMVNDDPLGAFKINEINRIHSGLRHLEIDARKLIQKNPASQNADEIAPVTAEPFLLLNPLPQQKSYSIERITEKFRNIGTN